MNAETPIEAAHAPEGHPAIPRSRVGVLLANLGTPDGHDYWSMRRYLSEFLSDRRVIDYPRWKWQPLLQTVILARLASDHPVTEPEGFRALLNSFLPRKRAISQLLVRDQVGRVLICQLTYKRDWDLPGGVVEVGAEGVHE